MGNLKFSPHFRVRAKKDIAAIFSKLAVVIRYDTLVFRFIENYRVESRLLLCFNKKSGNACQRNFMKRLFREAFRKDQTLKYIGFDIAVICYKKPLPKLDYTQVELYLAKLRDYHLVKDKKMLYES